MTTYKYPRLFFLKNRLHLEIYQVDDLSYSSFIGKKNHIDDKFSFQDNLYIQNSFDLKANIFSTTYYSERLWLCKIQYQYLFFSSVRHILSERDMLMKDTSY